MSNIIDLAPFRIERQKEEAARAVARQLLDHGIIAMPVSYVDYCLPCDVEHYSIEINAPAALPEAPDFSK